MEHMFDLSNRMPRSDGLADPQQCPYLLRHFLFCPAEKQDEGAEPRNIREILEIPCDDIFELFPAI
jgi:hypothetical protein